MAEDCEATACCASIIDELDRVCGELDGLEAASIAALQPLVDIVNDPAGIFVGTPGGDLATLTELVNRINNFAGGFDEWVFTETRSSAPATINLPSSPAFGAGIAASMNGVRISQTADYRADGPQLTLVDPLEVDDQLTVKSYGQADYGPEFIFSIETTGVDDTFTLPLVNVGTYNAVVDWGDGGPTSTITAFDDPDITHTYSSAGNYFIQITGSCPGFRFNSGVEPPTVDALKVRTIEQWGDVGFLSLILGFMHCSEATSLTAPDGDAMEEITDMQRMFYGWGSAVVMDVSSFSTSKVTNMHSMFYLCSADKMDVSGWNVQALENATNMFLASNFSDSDYDALLAAWSQQPLQQNVPFHAGTAKYTNAAARAILTDTYNWTITDGGPA